MRLVGAHYSALPFVEISAEPHWWWATVLIWRFTLIGAMKHPTPKPPRPLTPQLHWSRKWVESHEAAGLCGCWCVRFRNCRDLISNRLAARSRLTLCTQQFPQKVSFRRCRRVKRTRHVNTDRLAPAERKKVSEWFDCASDKHSGKREFGPIKLRRA